MLNYLVETEKTLEILKQIPEKHPLTPEEKEAIAAAVGLLSLIAQSKNKAKAQKAKRDKSIEW